MKYLIIGLGSMGKRRIRNLQYLNEKEIIGFDLREDRRKEVEEKYKIKTYGDIKIALEHNPDALIISTPPNHHLEYELLATEHKKHFFCEAGVFSDRIEELISLSKQNNIVAAPSCTFRFQPSIIKIKELVDNNKIGNICTLTYHMGQWLPDWHPWENITKFYVGQRDTSATREMLPFEMEWITWILGDVKQLSCLKGKTSNLKADIDDVYQAIFQLESGLIGHILIEVISRTATRIFRLVGDEGTIEWNWADNIVKLYETKTKKWTEFKEEEGFKEEGYVTKENMYIDEMNHFINAIKGKEQYMYSLEDDLKIIHVLEAAEKSSKEGKHIII